MTKLRLLFTVAAFASSLNCAAQVKILPGDKSLNTSLIKQGDFSMDYFENVKGSLQKIGVNAYKIEVKEGKVFVTRTVSYTENVPGLKEELQADAATLKPIRRIFSNSKQKTTVAFGASAASEILDIKTGKKSNVTTAVTSEAFDYALHPLVISILPLKSGYKAIIPVITNDLKLGNLTIVEVKSNSHQSNQFGNRPVWDVTMVDDASNNFYSYSVDKETRKIWFAGMRINGITYLLKDLETDVNPFKTTFNKDETFKLVSAGSSTIEGEAFARDDRSRRDDRGIDISILNVNKKQFAPKGTNVLLMPYTAYFKEWFEINKKQSKIKGAKPIPLPKDALECLKQTQVYDDKGHFEFTNLMPGEYLLYITFGYEDFFSRTEETGRANVYVNGQYAGTEVYTGMFG
ncbi:MAG: hypothetical protein IT249_16075, partial [Chitinophagaceae bacterium]|nr:hypothetical protein [Chitinophagaceae bacterium]